VSLMDARPPVDTAITNEGWERGGVKWYSHTEFESGMADSLEEVEDGMEKNLCFVKEIPILAKWQRPT